MMVRGGTEEGRDTLLSLHCHQSQPCMAGFKTQGLEHPEAVHRH